MPVLTAAHVASIRSRKVAFTADIARMKPSLIAKARADLARNAPTAAVLQAAKAKARAVVVSARAKAASQRLSQAKSGRDLLDKQMKASKAKLSKRWKDGSLRTPKQVVESVMARIKSAAPAVSRARQTVLLIRSGEATIAAFGALLANQLGLVSVASLKTYGIQLKQVTAPAGGREPLYSVRLPIRRSSMHTEVHNLAWALRKSGRFRSVRPDGGARMIFAAKPGHAIRAERVFAWHLDQTRADLAHDLIPPGTGAARGRGIVIAHPDTGWAQHPNLNQARIDRQSFNASTGRSGVAAARTSEAIADAGIPNINHGTATASIMVGAARPDRLVSTVGEAELDLGTSAKTYDFEGTIIGVAPEASVRSIKFIDDVAADIDRTGINGIGVVRFADEDLIEAINYACNTGAHVISLSVGGLMHEGVQRALDRAIEEFGIIVVAAAGQTYTGMALSELASAAAGIGMGDGDTVVLPAAYSNVIAVAGCTSDGRPWDESLRGPNIDITAPADGMWVADFSVEGQKRTPVLECASGTSFAAAFMAGVAALWLAHWDRATLLDRYRDTPLAWVFRHQLQRTARSLRKDGWDTGLYGPGIVDVLALLREPLPDRSDVSEPPATVENIFTVLSNTMDSPLADAALDAWGLIWDFGTTVSGGVDAFGDAAWAAVRSTADRLVEMGEQALTDLNAWAESTGRQADRTLDDAVAGTAALIETASKMGEEAAEAAADAAEASAEAASDFVEKVADTVGEAAESVAEMLFGWT